MTAATPSSHPVAHSKSPVIHAEFARQTGQDLVYERILARSMGFCCREKLPRGWRERVNVTLPFKLEAFRLSDDCSRRARDAEAVILSSSRVRRPMAIIPTGWAVRDFRTTWIARRGTCCPADWGAGVAAGALGPLLDPAARLVIANRTVEKAEQLAERFRAAGGFPAAC